MINELGDNHIVFIVEAVGESLEAADRENGSKAVERMEKSCENQSLELMVTDCIPEDWDCLEDGSHGPDGEEEEMGEVWVFDSKTREIYGRFLLTRSLLDYLDGKPGPEPDNIYIIHDRCDPSMLPDEA